MFGHDKHQDEENNTTAPRVSDSDDAAKTDTNRPQPEMTLPEPTAQPTPALSFDVPAPTAAPVPDGHLVAEPNQVTHGGMSGDLAMLKRDALKELSPLVDHLDQSPQEKYEMAKLMYEETRDQAMLTKVYEAARNLPDEKAKAMAIYDVIKTIDQLH